jgi:tRNA threonylcarbamoyladenosine biosynthesis protein TsaB
VAILRDGMTVGVISTRAEENYSSRLFRHLDFLLNDLSLRLDQFDMFAVCAGPGSFTGLRVGLTAAKGWAEVYRKPVAGISALEAVAVQASGPTAVLVPALDARRGQIYFGVYRRTDKGLVIDGEEYVVTPTEFAERLRLLEREGAFTIVTPEAEIASEAMRDLHLDRAEIAVASSVLAPFIGRVGYERALHGRLSDALTLDANYVRRTDAEMHWKDG